MAECVWNVAGKVQIAARGAAWLSAADVQESSPHALREEGSTWPDAEGSNAVADSATSTARPADFTQSVKATLSGAVLLTGVCLAGLATLKDGNFCCGR